jgi:hypothetical protein
VQCACRTQVGLGIHLSASGLNRRRTLARCTAIKPIEVGTLTFVVKSLVAIHRDKTEETQGLTLTINR